MHAFKFFVGAKREREKKKKRNICVRDQTSRAAASIINKSGNSGFANNSNLRITSVMWDSLHSRGKKKTLKILKLPRRDEETPLI